MNPRLLLALGFALTVLTACAAPESPATPSPAGPTTQVPIHTPALSVAEGATLAPSPTRTLPPTRTVPPTRTPLPTDTTDRNLGLEWPGLYIGPH